MIDHDWSIRFLDCTGHWYEMSGHTAFLRPVPIAPKAHKWRGPVEVSHASPEV